MKMQTVFDTSSPSTIAASDSIGAFVRSSDGTLITHTTVGGKEGLDVNIVNTLGIDVDLDHTEDSVRLGDGTSYLTSTTVGGDIGLDVNIINSTVTVSDAALANTAVAATATNATGTVGDVVASPLANRKYLYLLNNGNQPIYIGESGVADTAGFPISPKAYVMLRCGAAIDLEMVTSGSTQQARTLELS